jgi:hypothetical protein
MEKRAYEKTSNIIRRFFRESEFQVFLRTDMDGFRTFGRSSVKWFSFELDETNVFGFLTTAMIRREGISKLVFSTYGRIK